ncbi:ThuA domain-containing protein [Geofilum rubicundum]|uniref:ThuA domain-containing protein n=1 Tax=Geofilum rubicundum TaxID=472113 RepID=UPI0009FD2B9F|nr:ThuA domain-containing protein [Geofilum rubicundum]
MRLTVLFLLVLFLGSCDIAHKASEKPLEVLVVTDDRSFNREAFWAVFERFENVNPTEITHPEVLDFFGTDSVRQFDALVFYDMPEVVVPTEEQKQHMLQFFKEGAPAIFLHHSLLSYREWDQFTDIIGGRYYNKSPLITEEGDTLQSVYQHDVEYRVNVVNAEHPITSGMEDFDILDEVYNHYFVKDDVEVLLTTNHELSGHELGWINTFGKSRIVFLINGHGETAYENPNFRQLLHNAIHWVAAPNGRKD